MCQFSMRSWVLSNLAAAQICRIAVLLAIVLEVYVEVRA